MFSGRAKRRILDVELGDAQRNDLTKEELREFFRISYEVNRKADPKTTLLGLSRFTRVVGEMLQAISDGYRGVGRRPAAWLARFGRLFWGLVEVAVPRSLVGEIIRYWLILLYFFEVSLIAASRARFPPSEPGRHRWRHSCLWTIPLEFIRNSSVLAIYRDLDTLRR